MNIDSLCYFNYASFRAAFSDIYCIK